MKLFGTVSLSTLVPDCLARPRYRYAQIINGRDAGRADSTHNPFRQVISSPLIISFVTMLVCDP